MDAQPMKSILDRISREVGVGNLVELLADRLSPTDLQSLLLQVFRRRSSRLTAPAVLRRYEGSRFLGPSPVDPRLLLAFDQLAFEVAAPRFDPLELSPVAPLGSISVLGDLDQNMAVSTVRNNEVVSDSTNVMALECAHRRNARGGERRDEDVVRLCSTHRLLRAQAYESPELQPHFRLFGLCTAGRTAGGWQFELDALLEQIGIYLDLLRRVGHSDNTANRIRVAVTTLEGGPSGELVERALASLRHQFPGLTAEVDPERTAGRGYYAALCFEIAITPPDASELSLVDGGFTHWTQLLLSDRKERLLISGIGSERICAALMQDH